MSIQLILICLVVMAYPLIATATLKAAGPARDEFAELAKRLLADPKISEKHKIAISDMIDDVFDWKFMAYATFAFPLIAFSNRASRDLDEKDREFMARDDVSKLFQSHMRAVMGASPAFTAAFVVVAALTVLVLIAFVGFSVLQLAWADTVKRVSPHTHENGGIHSALH